MLTCTRDHYDYSDVAKNQESRTYLKKGLSEIFWLYQDSRMSALGSYLRERRLALHKKYRGYSIRAVAQRIGIHHSYLSKLERGEHAPLTDERILALARDLGEDEELLLALGGKLPARLSDLIRNKPETFIKCVLELESGCKAAQKPDAYTNRLEHRKSELENLTRMLRDEIKVRQQLERKLVQEEAEKRTILTNLKDVVVEFIDADFNLIWGSPAVEKHLSCSMDEAIGHKCYLMVMGREEPCPNCIAKRAIETGEIQEGKHTSQDGRYWNVRSVPLKDGLGQVEKVVHFGFDVTKLVEAQQAFESSERRWRFALEGAQEGVWDWDATNNKVFFSQRWKEMLGFDEDEIGDTLTEWDSRIHPDDYEAVYEALNRHMYGDSPYYEFEHRLRCKDGSYKWILDRGIVVERDADNSPLRAIGTHFDISERKEIEERLRERESFLGAILMSIQEGISVLKPDLTIEYVNPIMEKWYGGDVQLVGRKCHDVYHGRGEPCLKCPSLRCLKSKRSEWDIVEVRTSKGLSTVEVFCYPITNAESGDVDGVVEFIRNITDKRRMESSIEELEGRYKAIFDKNPTVQLLINPETGSILDCNKAALDFYGYNKDELSNITVFDINTLSKNEIFHEMELAKSEQRSFFNFKHRLKNGEVKEVESRTTPIQFDKKTLLHSLVIDVTERNEALAKIAYEHDKLNTLIENIPDIVCLKDEHGCWVALNKAGRTLLGLDVPSFLGKTYEEILLTAGPESKPFLTVCRAFDSKAWELKRLVRSEKTTTDENGFERIYDILAVPMFHPDGTRRGMVVIARDISEIRIIERRKTLLASIIENTSNICVIKDLDLRVIATNQAFANAAGYVNVEDMIGKTDAEIFSVSPDTYPVKGYMDDERMVHNFQPGQVLEREEKVIYPDGEEHVVSTRKFPIFDSTQNLIATANISTDVTEAFNAREQLVQAENKYRTLIENAPIGICSMTLDGSYLSVNSAHAALYGYDSPEEMLASVSNARDLYVDPSERETLIAMLDRLDVVTNFECCMKKKDGTPFWTSRTLRAIRDDKGVLQHYEAFVEDIESRKVAELAAENARRQLLGVLEQLEAGVYVIDPSTRHITYANNYLARAMGQDVVGQIANTTLLKDPASCAFLSDCDEFKSPGDVLTREMLFANDRWYYCTAKLMPWIEEKLAVLVVAMDITLIKKAESMKEDVDRMMRHDLKSPLNGIIALPEILLEAHQFSNENAELLQAISDSGRKMLNLIDASLSLYKLETGSYEIKYGWLDMMHQVQTIEKELSNSIRYKQLRFDVSSTQASIPNDSANSLCGDVILLPFLLSNLIKNAVEAAPEKSIISIRLETNATQTIIIHNQGVVPDPMRECFFEKYTTCGKSHGTGLGTYSAMIIAQAHGGDIAMNTSEHDGTTITVTLPIENHQHCSHEA